MIENYLKIAWRNLFRNKFFSAINILGLALGMACSILILLWVQNELNIDAYHANSSRLYQVIEREHYDGKIEGQYNTPGILADELKKVIPDVEFATEFDDSKNTFQVGEKILKVDGGYAGADIFKMFSYPLLEGNTQTALNSPSDIAISRKMAEDFFGSPQAAIGKQIRYENKQSFNITAVFENLPESSSIKFDYLINWFQYLKENSWANRWDSNGPLTYVMLRQNAKSALVDRKVTRFLDAYYKTQNKAYWEELGLQKFDKVYLNSDFKNGKPDGGRIDYVHLFSLVAVFILVIACINFMNLTTARSIKRAKEIGIRKVVGAVRSVLVRQFLGEAILLTFVASLIAMVLVLVLLPVFNSITQKQIAYPFLDGYFWLSIAGLSLVTGIVSGSYPALFLSSFSPASVLKGSLKTGTGALWFRKGLVVFQFVLSCMLIIGTVIISKQVNFIQTKNLGYDRENLIYVHTEGDLAPKYEVFKNAALRMPGIQLVSRISSSPVNYRSSTGSINWEGKDPDLNIEFTHVEVGYDFVPTMKLKVVEGRDFSKNFSTDSLGYLINQTALKRIGYTDPVGKTLSMWGKKGKIIGVLQDFHFNSLHHPIQPLIVRLHEHDVFGNILVRTRPGQTKEALATIEKLCKALNPNFTFSYAFADQEYQKLYRNEQVIGNLSNVFAFLGIFISCLGLLGLAMFTAEQRIKEIGIRKVLGASVASLFALLSREFLVLVLIALFIASPIAWYAMDKWLSNYEYHTRMDWWIFALSAVVSIAIALITVSFQSLKAALMNPVKSLRSE